MYSTVEEELFLIQMMKICKKLFCLGLLSCLFLVYWKAILVFPHMDRKLPEKKKR